MNTFLRIRKNGEKIINKIYFRNEIYNGKYLDCAPDIVILPNEGYEIYIFSDKNILIFEPKEEGWSAVHKLHGIFCISGSGIKKNQEIKNAKIIDLAPTILHLFDVAIPDDIDGRVLTECFEKDSELAKRKPIKEAEKISEDVDDALNMLKNL